MKEPENEPGNPYMTAVDNSPFTQAYVAARQSQLREQICASQTALAAATDPRDQERLRTRIEKLRLEIELQGL